MEEPRETVVYYIQGPIAAARLRRQISQVEEEMESTRRRLRELKRTRRMLGRAEAILAEMKACAIKAANDPAADRASLNDRAQQLKGELLRLMGHGE